MQNRALNSRIVIFLIIMVLGAGCVNPQTETVLPSIPVNEQPSATHTVNPPTETSTPLVMTATTTLTSTPKATSTPNFGSTATQVYWLENANTAFSIAGQGFFLGRSDSEDAVKITGEEVSNFQWSPDGKKLAYLEGDSITIIDMDSGEKTKLKAKGTIAWHPSSQFLVVGKSGQVVLINANTSKEISQASITEDSGWSSYVSFSPDGSQLAYLESISLYIVDLILDENGLPSGFGEAFYVSDKVEGQIWRVGWSPAGDRLALLIAPWPGDPFIGFISSDGNLRSKVNTPDFIVNEFLWSPDGRYLALQGFGSTYPESRIYVFDYQSKALTTVHRGGSLQLGCMDWTDDRKKVVYLFYNYIVSTSEFILSDIAGIQKQVMPVSALMKGESTSGCVQFRPGRTISTVAIPTPTPDPLCTVWPQLQVDGYARMVDTVPNRVRSAPEKGDNLVGKLNPGDVVKVLEGPVCADGLVFWRVESDSIPGSSGWTAEGDGKEYWLEPINP